MTKTFRLTFYLDTVYMAYQLGLPVEVLGEFEVRSRVLVDSCESLPSS